MESRYYRIRQNWSSLFVLIRYLGSFKCFLQRVRKKVVGAPPPPIFSHNELGIDITQRGENLMYGKNEDAKLHLPAFDSGNRWSSVGATVKWRGRCFYLLRCRMWLLPAAFSLRPGNYPLRSSLNTKAWKSTLLFSGKGLNFLLKNTCCGCFNQCSHSSRYNAWVIGTG